MAMTDFEGSADRNRNRPAFPKVVLNTLLLRLPFVLTGPVPESVSSVNPNALPESTYPYWPWAAGPDANEAWVVSGALGVC
jgi:hypothetical protein